VLVALGAEKQESGVERPTSDHDNIGAVDFLVVLMSHMDLCDGAARTVRF
jgi:hypothetical protein